MSLTYTDVFCGFGGSSLGLEAAGLELRLAANHWDKAIAVHSANFVHADHLIADVSNYDMRRLPRTEVLWASPICTELSPAGGRRRRQAQLSLLEPAGHVPTAGLDRTRATFWDVVRATEVHRYRVVLVENVVEAAAWELFDVWLAGMDTLGYRHQFVSVSSAHIGDETNPHAPQWRDRLYIVFTERTLPLPDVRPAPLAWCPDCDQVNPAVQSWKRPERRPIGKYRQQYVYRCPNAACRHAIVEPFVRPAATAIDWSDLGERIGDRQRPLAPATMRRIQAGIDQFAQPVNVAVHGNTYERPGSGYARSWPTHASPLTARTATAGDGVAVPPFVVATNHDGDGRAYPAHDAPMSTRSTKLGDALACPPFLLDRRDYHGADGPRLRGVDEPMGAVTAAGRTVRTLVTPPLVVPAGGTWNDTASPVDEPFRTRVTRDTDGLATPAAWITVLRNHADATAITDPLATVTTGAGGGGHQALTVPPGAFVQEHHGGLDYRGIEHMTKPVSDALPSVVARANLSLVIPYRKGHAKTVGEPLHTVATRDSAALATAALAGVLEDTRFRMLKPREHGRAQRFPDSYLVAGCNQSEQTIGFGNAVSSNVAQWLGGIIARLLGDAA